MTRGDPGAGLGQALSRQFAEAPEAGRRRKQDAVRLLCMRTSGSWSGDIISLTPHQNSVRSF